MKAGCTKWKASLSIYGKISRYLHPECYFCNAMITHLVISKGTEMLRVPVSRLVYVSADGNYANVVTQDNRSQMVSFQLGQVEDMLADQLGDEGGNFVRLGRGLIVNTDFVHLVDVSQQRLVLSDCAGCYHELSASREVLIKLKAYIDATLNHG